jgi:hypothetical protein
MKRTSRGHSAETRAKISASMQGEKNHNYGKPLSDEHKQKISTAMIAYWKTIPADEG